MFGNFVLQMHLHLNGRIAKKFLDKFSVFRRKATQRIAISIMKLNLKNDFRVWRLKHLLLYNEISFLLYDGDFYVQ